MMDMFHTNERETTPIPGFEIVDELPTKGQTSCPPKLPYEGYAFTDVEVATSARLLNAPPEPSAGNEVPALLEFVVGTDGVVEVEGVRVIELQDERMRGSLAVNLLRYRFSPAEHHAGCPVRQRVNGVFLLDRSLGLSE
jgi:hypothetical protein